MAELQHRSRAAVQQGALSSWFAYATGFPVLEVECTEQRQHSEDDVGAHLVFRIRLSAAYAAEVAKVPKAEDLCSSFPGYASTAYFYNLGRFKFDAEQRQDCIYQIQNMRLAQWGLFRKDAVPQLEVFLQGDDRLPNFSRSFRWGQRSLERFDRLRRWLLLLWNNCVFACITFGLVSVWLALHGSIAQRSARVKILTQAVRPPVPSLKDIQEAMRAQEIGA
eukprot:g9661.t1